MEAEAAKYIAKGMIILSMLATAIGEGMVAAKAMEAIGRNPDAGDSIFSKMIVAMAICESTAIYALVAFFTL
jgi:F-type H+-transporting ATPase subunit c